MRRRGPGCRRAVRERPIVESTCLRRDAVGQLLQSAAKHLVIVAPERITRHVCAFRCFHYRLRRMRFARQVVHANHDDPKRPWHELAGPAAFHSMPCHIIHVAVPPAIKPCEQPRLGGRQVAVGNADLLEAQLRAP